MNRSIINPRIENIAGWLVIACLAVVVLAQIPKAMDGEVAFNSSIREARCEHSYIKGYCDVKPATMAEAGQ